jgi:hypothetical protein
MKKQRGKKGTRTSSSSAAANLLSKHGLNPAVVSLGFGAFSNNTFNHTTTNTTSTTVSNRAISSSTTDALPHELAALLRHAIKPSKQTRLRALINLKAVLFSDTSAANNTGPPPPPPTAGPSFTKPQLRVLVQHFVTVFKTIQNDDDRRVREAGASALTAIVRSVKMYKPALSTSLRDLSSPWWMSMNDPAKEVARLANEAFAVAFPTLEHRANAVTFCAPHVASAIVSYLSSGGGGGGGGGGTSKSKGKQKTKTTIQRKITSSILSLRSLLSPRSTDKEATLPPLVPTVTPELRTLLSAQLWQKHFIASSDNATIRKSCYELMLTLVNHHPSFLTSNAATILPTFFRVSFAESHRSNHVLMWEAVLTVLSRMSTTNNQIWSLLPAKSNTSTTPEDAAATTAMKPLLTSLRKGAHGAGRSCYRSMLPLMSLLPIESNHLRMTLIDSIVSGMSSDVNTFYEIENRSALIEAHCECLQYQYQRGNAGDSSTSSECVNRLLQMVEWSLKETAIKTETIEKVGACHFLAALSLDNDAVWSVLEQCVASGKGSATTKNAVEVKQENHEFLPAWSCSRLIHLLPSSKGTSTKNAVLNDCARKIFQLCLKRLANAEEPEKVHQDVLQLVVSLSNTFGMGTLAANVEYAYNLSVNILHSSVKHRTATANLPSIQFYVNCLVYASNGSKDRLKQRFVHLLNNFQDDEQHRRISYIAFIISRLTTAKDAAPPPATTMDYLWCDTLSNLCHPMSSSSSSSSSTTTTTSFQQQESLKLLVACMNGAVVPKEHVISLLKQCIDTLDNQFMATNTQHDVALQIVESVGQYFQEQLLSNESVLFPFILQATIARSLAHSVSSDSLEMSVKAPTFSFASTCHYLRSNVEMDTLFQQEMKVQLKGCFLKFMKEAESSQSSTTDSVNKCVAILLGCASHFGNKSTAAGDEQWDIPFLKSMLHASGLLLTQNIKRMNFLVLVDILDVVGVTPSHHDQQHGRR